jgi:4-amino-4-deoxy-L-arabinose transferase-like glycosyltransferase
MVSAPSLLFTLIAAGTAARIVLAASLGLGIDESYMVAAGRGGLQLGYFDHPLMSWWISAAAASISEAGFVVRLPFIGLFALSTLLMHAIARDVAGERAGLWAAIAFNLSPVFGLTTASWVLPDGPLVAALLGMTWCLLRGFPTASWRWWGGAGVCAGLAMLSKYTAVLPLAGAALFVLAQDRAWLRRPQPYLAAALALGVFSPVIIWNAHHGWASLAFQGGRAAAAGFRPLGPLTTLAGEAAFLLPWIWAGLMLVWWRGFFGTTPQRLLCWMAAPAILLFVVISFWSRQVLFHWAVPGYLMLFPLLGAWLADRAWAPRAATATAALLAVVACVVVSEVQLAWLPVRRDPALQARTWAALRPLVQRNLPIASISWADTGKVAIGLGPNVPVYCLNADARQFSFATTPPTHGDLLIIAPNRSITQMRQAYGDIFGEITEEPSIRVGRTDIPVFLGHALRRWPGRT